MSVLVTIGINYRYYNEVKVVEEELGVNRVVLQQLPSTVIR